MKKTTQIPSKVDFLKLTAGDMAAQQEAVAALSFAWRSIFVNSHHRAVRVNDTAFFKKMNISIE